MLNKLQNWNIKSIIWDVDGTLADLNRTYYKFITTHPQFKEYFKGLKYQELDKANIKPFENKKQLLRFIIRDHSSVG